MALMHKFTRTDHVVRFADPYKKCLKCGKWVDGVLEISGPLVLVPCMHNSNYRDMCPSWGPVYGCSCPSEWHEPRLDIVEGKVY